jgi:hypothetical protein
MNESMRQVPLSKGKALADEFGLHFFETSAKVRRCRSLPSRRAALRCTRRPRRRPLMDSHNLYVCMTCHRCVFGLVY